MWDPVLDAAVANNELPPGLPRSDIHLWLGNVTVMVMRGLEDGDGDVRRYRSILRRFVVPAFASAKAHSGRVITASWTTRRIIYLNRT